MGELDEAVKFIGKLLAEAENRNPRTFEEKLATLDHAVKGIANRKHNLRNEIAGLQHYLSLLDCAEDENQERRERLVAAIAAQKTEPVKEGTDDAN